MRTIATIIVLAFSRLALAQIYEGSPCKCGDSPSTTSTGFPRIIAWGGYVGEYETNASSCLYAGKYRGKKYPTDPPADDLQLEEWETGREAHANHTCRYSAHRIADRDTKTSWCEGAAGIGASEVVGRIVGSDPPSHIEVFAGFGKAKSLHAKNSRPRKVRIHIVVAKEDIATQVGMYYQQLEKVAKVEVELEDEYGFQRIDLPSLKADPMYKAWAVFLEILSVYPGSKYQDTCIAEIRIPADLSKDCNSNTTVCL
ncbi:hypothetical protein ACFL6C_01160 [Myxococcota bacterium]